MLFNIYSGICMPIVTCGHLSSAYHNQGNPKWLHCSVLSVHEGHAVGMHNTLRSYLYDTSALPYSGEVPGYLPYALTYLKYVTIASFAPRQL